MVIQQTQAPAPDDTETDLEPKGLIITPGESTTLNILGSEWSERKEDEKESSLASPTSDACDFPDGGFAAWCVVLGVSQP